MPLPRLVRCDRLLLAGRAVLRHLHPYVPEELGSEFSLAKVLETGALPIIRAAESPKEALTSYAQLYLKEEIQAEAATRNLAGFARFLPIAGLFHSQVLNVSSLARDAGVARTTVQGYLQILEDTLLTFQIPAFEGRLRVRERRHPKLYWVDPGLVRAVTRVAEVHSESAARGALFEGWIAQSLRAYNDYNGLYDAIAYWAPADAQHTEVDFLLRRGRRYVAIEVKPSRRWRSDMAKGLHTIADLAGVERRIVVYQGDQLLSPAPGIEAMPVKHFFRALQTGL